MIFVHISKRFGVHVWKLVGLLALIFFGMLIVSFITWCEQSWYCPSDPILRFESFVYRYQTALGLAAAAITVAVLRRQISQEKHHHDQLLAFQRDENNKQEQRLAETIQDAQTAEFIKISETRRAILSSAVPGFIDRMISALAITDEKLVGNVFNKEEFNLLLPQSEPFFMFSNVVDNTVPAHDWETLEAMRLAVYPTIVIWVTLKAWTLPGRQQIQEFVTELEEHRAKVMDIGERLVRSPHASL